MSMSSVCGTAFIPTLSRVVLGAAFITAGYHKVFHDATYSGVSARDLQTLEVKLTPVTPPADDAEHLETNADGVPAESGLAYAGGARFVLASMQEADDTDDGSAADDDADTAEDESADDPLPIPEGDFEASAVHGVTLLVHNAGWPQPVLMARLAAWTELVGGGLILVGLFSRLWGLALAGTMGVAFYLTSLPAMQGASGVQLWAMLSADGGMGQFNTLFAQLGLFVLALGIFLTGPGPLSLDRAFFKKSGEREDQEEED